MSEEKKLATEVEVLDVMTTAFKEVKEKNQQAMYHLTRLIKEAPTYALSLALKAVQDQMLPLGSTDLLSGELKSKGFSGISSVTVQIIKEGQAKGH